MSTTSLHKFDQESVVLSEEISAVVCNQFDSSAKAIIIEGERAQHAILLISNAVLNYFNSRLDPPSVNGERLGSNWGLNNSLLGDTPLSFEKIGIKAIAIFDQPVRWMLVANFGLPFVRQQLAEAIAEMNNITIKLEVF